MISGMTNDFLAWDMCFVSKRVGPSDESPSEFYAICDEAFVYTNIFWHYIMDGVPDRRKIHSIFIFLLYEILMNTHFVLLVQCRD